MSFFEVPPPPAEPPETHVTPEWIGPADTAICAPFPLDVLLARTDAFALHVYGGEAYPNGFGFSFAMHLRNTDMRRRDDPIMRWHEHFEGGVIPDEVLRFGIEVADGRKATVFDRLRHRPLDQAPELSLTQRGGGGGSRRWEMKFWVWPLPPEGPVTFVVEWPSKGVGLTRHAIDSAPIREAAGRAYELWPGDPLPGGGWVGYA